MEDLLFKLLSIKTTSDESDNLMESAELVRKYLSNKNNKIHIEIFKKKKPCLVATTKKTKNPDLFLVGHLDVVEANYQNPFEPTKKGTRIYARGASDMKGVDVAMASALVKALSSNPSLNIGLMLTTDEEKGGFDGVNFLLNKKGYGSQVAFVPDGAENWKVCTEEKAVLHITVSAEGKAAHGSRPWLGINANDLLIKSYLALKNTFAKEWGEATKSDNWKPTLNLGVLKGGLSTNSVPDYSQMKLDIRFPSGIRKKAVENVLNLVFNQYPHISWTQEVYGQAMTTDKSNQYLVSWINHLNKKSINFDSSRDITKGYGASDARFFTARDIPVIMSKPTSSSPHIENEWIDYKQLILFKDILADWIIDNF